jgi:hypothetical protein
MACFSLRGITLASQQSIPTPERRQDIGQIKPFQVKLTIQVT